MFFRNLTLFRFSPAIANDLSRLDEALAEHRLRPCGPLEMFTKGFVPPVGRGENEPLTHAVKQCTLLTVGGEDKLLPAAVINDELHRKVQKIAEEEGRKVGGRERKRIKEDLLTELLPRAFVRNSRMSAYVDKKHGWLVLDTSSRKSAENALTQIREALGSFPALPLNAEVAPRSVLTGWVAGEPLPDGLTLGDECELRDPVDQGAVVKCQRMELVDNAEIAKHLETGKQVTRLALNLDDHVQFVLGEDLVIRKFKLLDGAVDQLDSGDGGDMLAELDARFALMSAEVKRLFVVLERALKLSRAEA